MSETQTPKTRVTVWNEFRHEKNDEAVRRIYPKGIHEAIAQGLADSSDLIVTTATLDEPEHGLTAAKLEDTDVLIWWGHRAHDEVNDVVVDRIHQRVLSGMGIIALHSSQGSKPFKRLMGTNCTMLWREADEKERLWNIAPDHEITRGVGSYFELANTEMYGERFDIPKPDEIVFISWFEGGNVFRSGCTWTRGNGRVFYFRPGHETLPIYHDPNIQLVIANACRWAAPRIQESTAEAHNVKAPFEPIHDSKTRTE